MIKWSNLELRLIELEMELERGGGAEAVPPPIGAVPPEERSPAPHDPEAMTGAATSALAARLDGGVWPPMAAGTRQQVRSRIRAAKSWTNWMRECAADLGWSHPGIHSASFARLLLVEMGLYLDDLRS